MSRKPRKDERQARILEALRYTPHLRIAMLADRFGVAAETIRRDLDTLSTQGLLDRAHGGAVARSLGLQPPVAARERITVAERQRIAATAAELCVPGQVVMIDAGSTTTQLAWQLAAGGGRLTVITNSHAVAGALASSACRVMLCPGEFDAREDAVFGQDTTDYLARFHADLAFVGASALGLAGVMDVNRQAVWIKRSMLSRCACTYLLVDHSKFDRHALEIVAPLEQLNGLITDRWPDGDLLHHLRRAGVRLHVADPASPQEPPWPPPRCDEASLDEDPS